MKRANIIFGSLFILLSVGIIVFTSNTFPASVSGVPGPALFPVLISGVMILAASLIIFHYLRVKEDEAIDWLADDTKRVYLAMIILAIYIILVPIIGFYVTSFILLLGLIKWFRKQGYVYTVVVSITILGFVYAVFNMFLRVPLTLGILF